MKPRQGFALIPIVVTDSDGERREAYFEAPLRQIDGAVFVMMHADMFGNVMLPVTSLGSVVPLPMKDGG